MWRSAPRVVVAMIEGIHAEIVLVAILLLGVVLYVGQWLPLEMTSIILLACLAVTGILAPEDLFSGFSNPATVTVGAMFVLSSAMVRTGALEFVAARIAQLSQGNPKRVLVLLALLVPPASAFMNNTPIVVMMVPVLLALCRELDFRPSKVMIPLSYFAILGGTSTLIGTSTNIIVHGMYREFTIDHAGEAWAGAFPLRPGFQLFDFTSVGLVYLAIGTAFLLLFAWRLLPERSPLSSMIQLERKAVFVTEVIVRPGSPLVGRLVGPIFEGGKLRLLELVRGEEIILPAQARQLPLQPDDALIIEGSAQDINAFLTESETALATVVEDDTRVPMRTIELKLAEAVVLPDSPFESRTVSELRLNARYGVKVMAVQRHGRQHRYRIRRMRVHAGDVLLVQADDAALNALRESEAVLVVEGVDRTVVSTRKAPTAILTLMGIVAVAALGGADIAYLAIIGVAVLLLTRCLRIDEALRSIDAAVLLLLAAMIPIGTAIEKTGLADRIIDGVLGAFGGAHPVVFLSAFYLLASVLTSIVSNNAVAVLLVPIAMGLAQKLPINHEALLIAVCFGASANFATPIGYQTNTIVMGPGGYTFRDYGRIGLPLQFLMWLTATVCIPLLWELTP